MTLYDKIAAISVFIVVLHIVNFLLRIVYKQFIAPVLNSGPDFKTLGKWAVVTGATDGLGKAYAEALAKRGMGIILISRNLEKLRTVAEEIEKKHKVETQIIQADFTKIDEAYKVIEKNINELEIGVLVNNVGLSYPNPEYFLEMTKKSPNFDTDLLNCNIFSVTNMTKLILPGMVERRKGVIINLSSALAKLPSPMFATYSASKAFIDKFTSNISTEVGKSGVIIQSVLPGFVATKMSKIKKATWMAPTPDVYVENALKTVNVEEHTYGYYPHNIMVGIIQTMEHICEKWARVTVIRILEKIRDRAHKKRAD